MPNTTEEETEVEVDETEAEAPTTFSAKELAARVNLDPKAFRRWLRRQTDNRAGKGGRWSFTAEEADALVAAFNKQEAEAKTEVDPDIEEITEDDVAELEELELDDED